MSNGDIGFRSFEVEGDVVSGEQALALSSLSAQLGLRIRETTPGSHEITREELAAVSREMFGDTKYGIFAGNFLEAMRDAVSIDLKGGNQGRLLALFDSPFLAAHTVTVGNLASTSQEATATLRKYLEDNKIFLPFEVRIDRPDLGPDAEWPATSEIIAAPVTDSSLQTFLETMIFDRRRYRGFTGKTIATMQKAVGLIDEKPNWIELDWRDELCSLGQIVEHMKSHYGGSRTTHDNFHRKLEEDIIGQLTLRVPEARLYSYVGLEVEGDIGIATDGFGLDLSETQVTRRTLNKIVDTYTNQQSSLPKMLKKTLSDIE